MLHKQTVAVAILATSILGFAGATASAQNPNFNYGQGQIVLSFQGINSLGGNFVLEVNLGNSSAYRRDNLGSGIADISGGLLGLQVINIGTLLTDNFDPDGPGPLTWYDSTNLFMGLATTWDAAEPPNALLRGDPQQTLYVSKARNAVGNELIKNSTLNTPGLGAINAAANDMISLQSRIEGSGTLAAQTYDKSLANTWEEFNVTDSAGVQSTAFQAFTGGIQFRFGTGSFNYSIGAQEGALDLYRIQAVNDLAGQYGQGGAIGTPEFEGIFALDQSGNVSYIPPVPEPTSTLLLGSALALGVAFRRRRAVIA